MYTESQYQSLITRFENLTLPKAEWTHEAHLAVAIWYVWQHDVEIALDLTRKGIRAHNEAVGTGNSDTEGYHETITRFWVETTARFMANHSFASPVEACHALILAPEGKSSYPLEFYDKEKLYSREARQLWVLPSKTQPD